jgi:hypothetical protein
MNSDRFLCLFLVFIIAFISCKRETKAIFPEEIQEEISQYIQTHKEKKWNAFSKSINN